MRNKLILFLMLALFGSTSFLRADEVTVGSLDGATANSYLPMNSLYNYSYSQQIYTVDEIGTAGTINSITMWMYGSADLPARTFDIYLKEVDKDAFTGSTDWVTVAASDMVYSGTVTFSNPSPAQAYTFTLTTPFEYSGEHNLLIAFNNLTGSWKSGLNGMTFGATGDPVRAIYVRQDSGAYDPYNPTFTATSTTYARDVVMLDITASSGPVNPNPTPQPGELSITPAPFALGDRPTNGWMEPYAVRIANGGGAVTITASVSNTAGANAFSLSQDIYELTLENGDAVDFEINYNNNAPDGEYTEEFTLFSVNNERDINVVPITANIYTAGEADIVETAVQLDMTFTRDNTLAMFGHTPTADDLHANYMLQGMTEMAKDAVYWFNLSQDVTFNVSADGVTNCTIAIYNFEDDFHPTAAIEPVVMVNNGEIVNQILLAGKYYMFFVGDNYLSMSGTAEAIPAPTELTYVNPSPADGATDVEAPVTLAWTGGENATQYQVLFGTSPVNMTVALDWTLVDENYGSYTITSLDANTQYFWQINVKNSNGTVEGPRWGFTTTLTAPSNVTASEEQIFTDESTVIRWRHNSGQGFSGEITVADGTSTNSYVPVYGLWCDYYTRGEMIYPADMLEEMVGGEISSLTFYLSSPATATWAPDVFQVYFQEVDATTLSTYYTAANAQICYTGYLDGTGTTMTINLDQPYVYGGGNLLLGIQETVNGNYKSASFYGIDATGASASGYNSSALANVTFNQRNFLPKVTFVCGAKGGNRNFLGYNVYYGVRNENNQYDYTKANDELITERQYTLSNLPYNVDPGLDINVTAVYSEGESGHSTGNPCTVQVSGYGKFTGHVTELISGAPVAGVNVKFTGKDEFQNNVMFEGTTNASGAYTINNVKAGNYIGKATLQDMEPATSAPVTLAYNTTETVDFVMHEVYNPVFKVFAQELDPTTAKVTWSLFDFDDPTPAGPTPGPGGGTGDEFSVNFDNSQMPTGWTTIDADGDGSNWMLASSGMGTGYGHNGSTDCILSKSYDNNTGVLYPDNYLVTPQVTVGANSTFSFWACAQDNAYAAEHFGVAVSTTTATASAFTMLQEWTMTAKGSGVMVPGRDGVTRTQGTWYEKTVDLSAYAGQQIYIAIRHFNCSDMFYLDVDDIALSNGSKNRAVQEYAVYRKAILKENELVAEDSVCFNYHDGEFTQHIYDTLYADFGWNNMEPGLYQYGVSAMYPEPLRGGSRDEVIIGEGTGTNSYVPTYNLYNYSCTNQIYTGEEIGGAGTINSIAFMPATVNTPSRNINVYMVNTDKTSFASGTDWIPVTDADLVYSGTVNWTANTWCTIELTNPFDFDGTNLCVIVNDLTGSWTSSNSYKVDDATAQAIRIYQDSAPYNPAAPGSGTVLNVKNYIKLDITFGGGSGNDNPITPITWSNVLPKDMETVVKVRAIVPDAENAEGVQFRFHNTFEQVADIVYTFTAEDDTVTFDNFRKGEYVVTATLADYQSNLVNTAVSIWEPSEFLAIMSEIFKPVDAVTVSKTGYAQWTNMMPEERYAERYIVTLDDALYAETTDNFLELNADDLTVGHNYQVGVAVVYTTGMSAYVKKNFTYLGCESVSQQVEGLAVDSTYSVDMDVVLVWNGGTPNPNPNPNPNPGPTGGFNEGFESGMPAGWTVIDNNNDGYTWCMTSAIPSTWTYYASLTLDWYRTGTNAICSGSYINGVGALTPDEYLVTSQVTPVAGSTFSFWAAATDASYPADHFGVAVSTTTATAGAFTMLNEWTLTAKDGAADGGRASRDGKGAKLGSWHEYSVDLSAYAGQNIYIAIRHFNCNDQYIMCVDDITFTTEAKAISDLGHTGVGYGSGNHEFSRDWYYYDNGTNADAIGLTSGGSFYWGVMFPAGTYEGNMLTKIAYFDYTAHTGTIFIYQGGTSAPGTQIYSQAYSVSGTSQYIEIPMDEPVELDETQNVWVVMRNNNGQYVAAIDGSPGVNYGSCLSTDGSTWYTMVNQAASSLDGNWNLRAYIEASTGATATTFQKGKYNILVDGVVVGATPANVTTFTYTCPDYENHLYEVVWVDNEFGISCRDGVEYQILPVSVGEFDVVNAIYPNPTSDDLHISAAGMTRISVVNALGQVVYDREVKCDEMVIKMAQFGSGVYSVRIATDNGTSVKRVVVNK